MLRRRLRVVDSSTDSSSEQTKWGDGPSLRFTAGWAFFRYAPSMVTV